VPRDLSVVGHDNIVNTQFCDPPLTTMELPIAATGTKLAEKMLARLGGADPGALQEVCEVRFIERESTAPPGG
jgi:LacI family transcriptional regulator